MEEKKENIIRFEMSKLKKFLYYKIHIIGPGLIGVLFITLLIQSVIAKHSLINMLEGTSALCGFVYILVLFLFFKFRRWRFATILIINNEMKSFKAYIFDQKVEVQFGVKDIKKIEREPYDDVFRFYLNDGTWFTWDSNGTNLELLEKTIKSFGLSWNIRASW